MQMSYVIVLRMTSLISGVVWLLAKCQGWRHCHTNTFNCTSSLSSSSSTSGVQFHCLRNGLYRLPTMATSGLFLLCPGPGFLACSCRCNGTSVDGTLCGADDPSSHVTSDVGVKIRTKSTGGRRRTQRSSSQESSRGRQVDGGSYSLSISARGKVSTSLGSNLSTPVNRSSDRYSVTTTESNDRFAIEVTNAAEKTGDNSVAVEIGYKTELPYKYSGALVTKSPFTDPNDLTTTSEAAQGIGNTDKIVSSRIKVSPRMATHDDNSMVRFLMTSSSDKSFQNGAKKNTESYYEDDHMIRKVDHVSLERNHVTLSDILEIQPISSSLSGNGTEVFNETGSEANSAISSSTYPLRSPNIISSLVSSPIGKETFTTEKRLKSEVVTTADVTAVVRPTNEPTTNDVPATSENVTTFDDLTRTKSRKGNLGIHGQSVYREARNSWNNTKDLTVKVKDVPFHEENDPMTGTLMLYDDCVISGSTMAFLAMVLVLISMVVILNCYGRRWDHVYRWRCGRAVTSPESRGLQNNDDTCPMTHAARISDVPLRLEQQAY